MQVQRKYVKLKRIEQVDKNLKDIFMNALNSAFKEMSEEEKERIYDYNVNEWNGCLNDFDLGNGVGSGITYLRETFEELDKTKPFDTGYSFKDINKVTILEKNDNSILLGLYHVDIDEDLNPIEKADIVTTKEINF